MFDVKQTIYQSLLSSSNKFPKKTAIYYMGRSISYERLLKMVNQMAFAFRVRGLKRGDNITLLAPNTPEAVATYYAASQLGLTISLLHPLSKPEKVKADMKEKNSKLLVTVSMFLCSSPELLNERLPILVIEIVSSLPSFKKPFYYLTSGKTDRFDYRSHTDVMRFKDVKSTYRNFVPYDNKEGRVYLASGGTSGVEKSIILSDYAFLSLISTGPDILSLENPEDITKCKMLGALPLFHGFGLTMGVMVMLAWGASVYLLPKFRTKDTIKGIKRGQCNSLIGVPLMYEALLKNKKFNGSFLKKISIAFVGGDFIAPSLLKRFNDRLHENGGNGHLYEGYGLTETVTVLSVNTDSHHKEGSIGKPLSVLEVKIIDDEGHVLPPNTKGEIAIAGETLMNGYLGSDGGFISIDGKRFIASGDIGYLDGEGYLYFLSRKKRMIKKKGFNIYPLQIEKAVSNLPQVEECAYLSRIEKGQEETYLFIKPVEGVNRDALANEITSFIRKNFYDYEVPNHIEFRDEFPQTKVAKIDYNALLDSLPMPSIK